MFKKILITSSMMLAYGYPNFAFAAESHPPQPPADHDTTHSRSMANNAAYMKPKDVSVIGLNSKGEKVYEALPPHIELAVAKLESKTLPEGLPDEVRNAVLPLAKLWTASDFPLQVCFFGGYNELRSRIANAANDWSRSDNNISFDFGSVRSPRSCRAQETNHIRIDFRYGGYWSTIGSDSANIDQGMASMNYGGWDAWGVPPSEDHLNATVRHEFGHALGYEHEHQHPYSKCEEEFDWPAIYAELAAPPNQWTKERVDHNMRRLNGAGRVISREMDAASVMKYFFKASFYNQAERSECYTQHENIDISAGDYGMASIVYPPTGRGDPERKKYITQQIMNSLGR